MNESETVSPGVNFSNFTKEEQKIVDQIVDRAYKLFTIKVSKLHIQMDISACNSTCPLDLERLLNASDLNFMHDILGIYQHLNRKTGELEDCFVPRFSKKEPVTP